MSSRIDVQTNREHGLALVSQERAEIKRRGERQPISNMVRVLVMRRDGWKCQRCGAQPYAASEHRRSWELHLDHIIPWSNGGSDRSDNLRTLCGKCNVARSNFVSMDDTPSVPVVRICTPCLAVAEPQFVGLAHADRPRFKVYCGAHNHESWAIEGWRIL